VVKADIDPATAIDTEYRTICLAGMMPMGRIPAPTGAR